MDLRAIIKTTEGRPSKTVLPPRTTKEIEIDNNTIPSYPLMLFSTRIWAKRSVFAVNVMHERGKVLLYNGGMETQWIEDGDIVAEY